MIKFSKTDHGETIELSTEDELLSDVLDAFRRFLLGAGYSIDGALEIVGEDEYVAHINEDNDDEEDESYDFEDELDDDTLTDGE